MKRTSAAPKAASTGGWGAALLIFTAVLVVSLYGVFLPGQTLFSNDGPLGQLMAECHRLPSRFTGCWLDTTGIGVNGGLALPDITFDLQWLMGPILFSKFYAIISLLLLGFGAWLFFRQLRLSPLACILGGLAAILSSTFFSVACWGMSAHVLAAAMSFFALAALTNSSPRWRWLRVILAGLAVGMGVTEGADVGAILSLYVAAFIVYEALTAEGSRVSNLAIGLGRLSLVTIFAGILASQAISALISTSIKGIAQTDESVRTPVQRWNWSTQWSLPKRETLGLVVPGLFGYRLDTPNGGAYWGRIGRDPAWDTYIANGSQGTPPKGFVRYTGGGYYAGVLVALIAFWAALQSVRRQDSAFNSEQRRRLWFWLPVAIVSLLFALGRFAPFYRLIYLIPYFNTIRNPVKYLYPFAFAVIVLFAFGVDALQRKYMAANGASSVSRWAGVLNWWKKATRFEKNWIYGCALIVLASMVAGLVYASNAGKVEQYLKATQVEGNVDAMFDFSIHRVVWFIVVFLLSSWVILLIFSGAFNGKRAKAGGILLGFLMVADLGLANAPWVIYWNYQEKYTSNPIVDFLRDKPYEHRVALTPVHLPPQEKVLSQLYQVEWLQHQFPYYNIQSFDMADMPRMPEDLSAFNKLYGLKDTNQPYAHLSRAWQLTNTRYILAPVNFGRYWNEQGYLAGSQLQTVSGFDIVPKPGVVGEVTTVQQVTALPTPRGRFGLFEVTNVLPRAKLYDHWQVSTNDTAAFKQLFDPAFDPQQTVLVSSGLPPDSATAMTNSSSPGSVDIVDYAPKDLSLKAVVSTPSVLLLNDHFDPNWKVLVDGEPAQMLRCNVLMQGVHLAPGTHLVEFRFRPEFRLIYVTFGATVLGLVLLGVLLISPNKASLQPAAPAAQPEAKPDTRKAPAMARNGKK